MSEYILFGFIFLIFYNFLTTVILLLHLWKIDNKLNEMIKNEI